MAMLFKAVVLAGALGGARALDAACEHLWREGNFVADAELIRLCKACWGDGATLQYVPAAALPYVAGTSGRTQCMKASPPESRSTPRTLPLRAECGEGLGDMSAEPGAVEKCGKCEGQLAHLSVVFIPFEGQNHTLCQPARRLHDHSGEAGANGDDEGDSNEKRAAFCEQSLRGEGDGDRRSDEEAAAACARCRRGGVLQFFPAGGSDGRGYSYCRVVDGRAARSTPHMTAADAAAVEEVMSKAFFGGATAGAIPYYPAAGRPVMI